ncbi:unnamed protein product [Meganyctiphanes norvegica]|uniref:Mitochondrial splicing suppressor 51-like C-terminal domain-containing protein n=1 Tax=Meganyctiphanes norvegica TaxID=48144 RepID=A0AAV2SKL8_MEGNR
MANWYLTKHKQLRIPDGLLDEATTKDGLQFEEVSKLDKYSSESWLPSIVNLINERLEFPLTIHHALKNLHLGKKRKTLSEMTSLTIHIVHEKPMLDPRMWEFFLHQLPKLKKLNLIFLCGIMKSDNRYNYSLQGERCSECKRKKRVINYDLQPMHYHEYFSIDDYNEPDVVVVFNIEQELGQKKTKKDVDEAHSFTSQRNMTYSKDTVVILTTGVEELLEPCVKSFQDARSVKILVPVQKNPFCIFSTVRANRSILKLNDYMCCIQGTD